MGQQPAAHANRQSCDARTTLHYAAQPASFPIRPGWSGALAVPPINPGIDVVGQKPAICSAADGTADELRSGNILRQKRSQFVKEASE
jgi:hypothetical protein